MPVVFLHHAIKQVLGNKKDLDEQLENDYVPSNLLCQLEVNYVVMLDMASYTVNCALIRGLDPNKFLGTDAGQVNPESLQASEEATCALQKFVSVHAMLSDDSKPTQTLCDSLMQESHPPRHPDAMFSS